MLGFNYVRSQPHPLGFSLILWVRARNSPWNELVCAICITGLFFGERARNIIFADMLKPPCWICKILRGLERGKKVKKGDESEKDKLVKKSIHKKRG